jgi:hypothetical protein
MTQPTPLTCNNYRFPKLLKVPIAIGIGSTDIVSLDFNPGNLHLCRAFFQHVPLPVTTTLFLNFKQNIAWLAELNQPQFIDLQIVVLRNRETFARHEGDKQR